MDETFQIPKQPNQPESTDMVSLETTGFNTPAITPRTEGVFNNEAYLSSLNGAQRSETPRSLKSMLAEVQPTLNNQLNNSEYIEDGKKELRQAQQFSAQIIAFRKELAEHDDTDFINDSRAA